VEDRAARQRARREQALAWVAGYAAVAPERLRQHPVEAKLLAVAERRDADRHVLVAGLGFAPVSPEQTIPPRQIESEIAVGFRANDRMMHAVHVGRHQQ